MSPAGNSGHLIGDLLAFARAATDVAVLIMPLAKRLHLSRTSFYWFFKDRGALLEALIDLWREKKTGSIIKQADAYVEGVTEALLNVMDCWLDRELFDFKI